MKTVEIEGKHYEITEYAADGIPVIKGHATTIHHTDEQGNKVFDEDGNPKISVHVSPSPVQEPTNSEKETK